MKINLKTIEIKDLNGIVYKVDDLHKQIGNILFVNAQSIEVNDKARVLHAGSEVEVSQSELIDMISIISSNPYYVPFIQSQILQNLNNVLTENQNKKKEETKNA